MATVNLIINNKFCNFEINYLLTTLFRVIKRLFYIWLSHEIGGIGGLE